MTNIKQTLNKIYNEFRGNIKAIIPTDFKDQQVRNVVSVFRMVFYYFPGDLGFYPSIPEFM